MGALRVLFMACLIPLVAPDCETGCLPAECPLGPHKATCNGENYYCVDELEADPDAECRKCSTLPEGCIALTCPCGLKTDAYNCPIYDDPDHSCGECKEDSDCFPVEDPCTDICPEAESLTDCEFDVDIDNSACLSTSSSGTCQCRRRPCHNIICPPFTYCAREGHRPVCTGPCNPMSCTVSYLTCPYGLKGTGANCVCECADNPCDSITCPSNKICCLQPLSPNPWVHLYETMRRIRCVNPVNGACPPAWS